MTWLSRSEACLDVVYRDEQVGAQHGVNPHRLSGEAEVLKGEVAGFRGSNHTSVVGRHTNPTGLVRRRGGLRMSSWPAS